MLRFLDCVNLLAPAGRQVNNCVRHLPREPRVTRPKTLNLISIGSCLHPPNFDPTEGGV